MRKVKLGIYVMYEENVKRRDINLIEKGSLSLVGSFVWVFFIE